MSYNLDKLFFSSHLAVFGREKLATLLVTIIQAYSYKPNLNFTIAFFTAFINFITKYGLITMISYFSSFLHWKENKPSSLLKSRNDLLFQISLISVLFVVYFFFGFLNNQNVFVAVGVVTYDFLFSQCLYLFFWSFLFFCQFVCYLLFPPSNLGLFCFFFRIVMLFWPQSSLYQEFENNWPQFFTFNVFNLFFRFISFVCFLWFVRWLLGWIGS